MKKKILFVTKALWIGGIETALINLLNNLDYNKYEVSLLVVKAELDVKDRICPQCKILVVDRDVMITFNKPYKYKRLFHLTEETEHPSKLHQALMWTVPIIKCVENGLYIDYIKSLLKNQYYDTVVIYSDIVAELAVRAINADQYLMFYHHGAMRHVYHDRIAYKKCKKIIAVSQNLAQRLQAFVPQYANKIIVIHNLTDVSEIIRKGKEVCDDTFDPNRYNIVSVGRIAYEKGMDIAVAACNELVNRGFKNIKWWIIGGGPATQEIMEQICALNIENYISLVGMKKNPYPYIRQADLYVQPSRIEAFGLTIKEAMVFGKKIIATNTDGAREILADEKLLCDSDEHCLADAIEMQIQQDPNTNAQNGDHIRRKLEQENRQIIECLEKLL